MSESERDLLEAIFDEMQELKRAMANQDERRVSTVSYTHLTLPTSDLE